MLRVSSTLSGAAFRSAWLFLILFLAVFVVAGAVIVSQTSSATESEIRALVSNEFELFRDASDSGGPTQLRQLIDDDAGAALPRFFAVALFDAKGDFVTGDQMALPPPGWSTISLPMGDAGQTRNYLALTEKIDGETVTFGRTLFFVEVASTALWKALLMAAGVVAVGALGIGYFLSHGVSAKLDRMAATLEQVARGDGAARLPVGRSKDQVDRVSIQINAHLDRLSTLLDTMRNTIVAIAHDLRSPLSRAYILLQEASGTSDEAERGQRLEQAQREVERLNGIFDTVLRISRIESSDDQSGFAPFSSRELLTEIVQTFEPVIEDARQTIADASPAVPPTIVGDRRMIAQMLVNLVTNASRYSPPGARIALSSSEVEGQTVLTVSDDGPGIPQARRRDVLLPFHRLNPERDEKGSGLGLALVQAIAARHRATVLLEDNRPGLRVVIQFPVAARAGLPA